MVTIPHPDGGLVTLGEALAVVGTAEPGPLRVGSALRFSFAGAESTVAVGMARLGHPAVWVGRVGDDEQGRVVREQLRAENVETLGVRVDPDAPTALLIKQARTADRTTVTYYRAASAGSRLSPDDLPRRRIRAAGVLHVTGITAALSPSAAEAVRAAIDIARDAGVPVSFDVNHRAALWAKDAAAPVLRKLAESADIVFAGPAELALITGCGQDEEELRAAARSLLERGVGEVVVKDGARGAWVETADEMCRCPALTVTMIDPVGAGDAFAAGYLSACFEGMSLEDRLRRGAALGAFCVSTRGDWEGLPRRAELTTLNSADDVQR
jgi:2-dehydro-3-deoxygluconokinase